MILDVIEDYRRFVARIGWRKNNRFISYGFGQFSLDAPEGHLPVDTSLRWGGRFFSRAENCNL